MTRLLTDLIIPARDEAENVAPLFDALPRDLFRAIILVDNGSRDATPRLAREAGATVVSEPRAGYGRACLTGLSHLAELEPAPEAVAFLDADMADDPDGLPALLAPLAAGEADLVIGCRHRLAEAGALTPVQRFGNRLSCRLIRLLTGTRFHDLGPMRAIRWDALAALEMADCTWGWTVEMQYKAAVLGLRCRELDVPYRQRERGASKISGTLAGSVRAGTKILSTIACLWWQTHRKRRKHGGPRFMRS